MHWAIDFYVQRALPFSLAPIGEFRQPENEIAFGVPIVTGSPQEVLEGLSVYQDRAVRRSVAAARSSGHGPALRRALDEAVRRTRAARNPALAAGRGHGLTGRRAPFERFRRLDGCAASAGQPGDCRG